MINATDDPFKVIERGVYQSPMRTYTVMVDEDMARDMLTYNRPPEPGKTSTNRKPSAVRIARYKAAMGRGEWRESPQPIIFELPDEHGVIEMVDGQQRLLAFLEYCKQLREDGVEGIPTMPFTVTLNAPNRVKVVLDGNKARTPADQLRMDGHKNAAVLSPATKLLYCFNEVPFTTLGQWSNMYFSALQQEKYLAAHDGLRGAVDRAKALSSLMSPHVAAVLCYLITQEYDAFKAEEFLEGLEKGIVAGITIEDARWKMREFLASKKREKYHWTGPEQLALAILAFNDWVNGWDSFKPALVLKNIAALKKFPELEPKAKVPDVMVIRA